MSTELDEEFRKKVTKMRKYPPRSKTQTLTRSPSRRKHHSPARKRTDPSRYTKEEIKYQHFVNDLKKDVQYYLHRHLRESGFDPSGNSSVSSQRMNPIHRPYSTKSLKNNEIRRFNDGIDAILTSPTFNAYYGQYLQPRPKLTLYPLEESIVWADAQE